MLELLRGSRYTLRLIKVVARLHLTGARKRLRELKKKEDPDIRYYATRALVQIGDASAVPELIDYLSGRPGDSLHRMDAHQVLKRVMRRDFGHPSAVLASRQENKNKEVDWRNWWNAYRDKMKWNPKKKRYTLKPGAVSTITVEPHK